MFRHGGSLMQARKIIMLALAISLMSQAALAYNRHGHHKSYKYAKEEFIPQPRFWGGIEYMTMWEQNGPVNAPLVTRNINSPSSGIIGEPGTRIIYGNESGVDLNYHNSNGGRLTLGGWIDDYHLYGLEANGFLLQKVYTNFDAFSPGGGFPSVSIPYFQTQPAPRGEAAVSANGNPNAISVNTSSQLWGAEVNFVYNISNRTRIPLELLAGFRYWSLNESLSLNDTIYDTVGESATDGLVSYSDSFQAQNNFYGLNLGVRSKLVAQKGLTLEVIGKVALGANAELLDIDGTTVVTRSALGIPSGVINGGIFAQQSNDGSFTHNTFAVLPEGQIKLGYMLAPNVRVYISYDVMYINNAIRPGNQIDRNINTTQNMALTGATAIVGGLSPSKPSFNNSSFLVQGGTAGLEVKL